LIQKKAFGSTKDTKRHENLKCYNKTVIHQTGYTMMLSLLVFLFVFFVDNCFL